jgi:hypothetical protein
MDDSERVLNYLSAFVSQNASKMIGEVEGQQAPIPAKTADFDHRGLHVRLQLSPVVGAEEAFARLSLAFQQKQPFRPREITLECNLEYIRMGNDQLQLRVPFGANGANRLRLQDVTISESSIATQTTTLTSRNIADPNDRDDIKRALLGQLRRWLQNWTAASTVEDVAVINDLTQKADLNDIDIQVEVFDPNGPEPSLPSRAFVSQGPQIAAESLLQIVRDCREAERAQLTAQKKLPLLNQPGFTHFVFKFGDARFHIERKRAPGKSTYWAARVTERISFRPLRLFVSVDPTKTDLDAAIVRVEESRCRREYSAEPRRWDVISRLEHTVFLQLEYWLQGPRVETEVHAHHKSTEELFFPHLSIQVGLPAPVPPAPPAPAPKAPAPPALAPKAPSPAAPSDRMREVLECLRKILLHVASAAQPRITEGQLAGPYRLAIAQGALEIEMRLASLPVRGNLQGRVAFILTQRSPFRPRSIECHLLAGQKDPAQAVTALSEQKRDARMDWDGVLDLGQVTNSFERQEVLWTLLSQVKHWLQDWANDPNLDNVTGMVLGMRPGQDAAFAADVSPAFHGLAGAFRSFLRAQESDRFSDRILRRPIAERRPKWPSDPKLSANREDPKKNADAALASLREMVVAFRQAACQVCRHSPDKRTLTLSHGNLSCELEVQCNKDASKVVFRQLQAFRPSAITCRLCGSDAPQPWQWRDVDEIAQVIQREVVGGGPGRDDKVLSSLDPGQRSRALLTLLAQIRFWIDENWGGYKPGKLPAQRHAPGQVVAFPVDMGALTF